MARTPRASVSKTSGQGVSRLAYQKGYKLKGGDAIKGPGKIDVEGGRGYAKAKGSGGSSFNVSYGNTYEPTDLDDVNQLFKDKPAKSKLDKQEAKKLK